MLDDYEYYFCKLRKERESEPSAVDILIEMLPAMMYLGVAIACIHKLMEE